MQEFCDEFALCNFYCRCLGFNWKLYCKSIWMYMMLECTWNMKYFAERVYINEKNCMWIVRTVSFINLGVIKTLQVTQPLNHRSTNQERYRRFLSDKVSIDFLPKILCMRERSSLSYAKALWVPWCLCFSFRVPWLAVNVLTTQRMGCRRKWQRF